MTMTRNERDLLLMLGEIFTHPENADTHRDQLKKVVGELMRLIKKDALEIKPGDDIAVKVIVTKIGDGVVYFRSDDGTEVCRRISDIVR